MRLYACEPAAPRLKCTSLPSACPKAGSVLTDSDAPPSRRRTAAAADEAWAADGWTRQTVYV
eukprot:1023485-Prymnesium_polylepis.1